VKNLLIAAALFCGLALLHAEAAGPRVALVVQNHCSGDVKPPMQAFSDVLKTALSGNKLFGVISPEETFGTSQNRTAAGENMPAVSTRELGRMVGADGVLVATIQQFSSKSVGVPAIAYSVRVAATMNLVDVATGEEVCGTSYDDDEKGVNYTAEQFKEDGTMLFEKHLRSVAKKLAADFLAGNRSQIVEWKPVAEKPVTVSFGCNVIGAVLIIDKLARGVCPMQVSLSKGEHSVQVSCPPYYGEFNHKAFFDGERLELPVVLPLTPAGEEQRMRALGYEEKLLVLEKKRNEVSHGKRMSDLEYEKEKNGIEAEQKERCALFAKQLELADAMLERYRKSGDVDDYVRKVVADGTSIYWKNSYGRVVITSGSGKVKLATPATDVGNIVTAPNHEDIGESLKELLTRKPGEKGDEDKKSQTGKGEANREKEAKALQETAESGKDQ